jgi:hypothetical protein
MPKQCNGIKICILIGKCRPERGSISKESLIAPTEEYSSLQHAFAKHVIRFENKGYRHKYYTIDGVHQSRDKF